MQGRGELLDPDARPVQFAADKRQIKAHVMPDHHTDIVAMDKDEASAEAEKGNPPGYEILGHENKVYKLKKTL